jgi:two-component system chemotaxis sensor kinase CheA
LVQGPGDSVEQRIGRERRRIGAVTQIDPRWQQLKAAFAVELEERVRELNRLLLSLEGGALDQSGRQETVEALFREAHSLKGAARAVEIPDVEQVAHALESALAAARDGAVTPEGDWFDRLYRAVDALPALFTAQEDGAAATGVLAELLRELNDIPRQIDGPAAVPVVSAGAPAPPTAEQRPEAPDAEAEPPGGPNQSPTAESVPAAQSRTPDGAVRSSVDTVRVAVAKLDALLAHAGQLAVTHKRVEQRLGELRELREDLLSWRRAWRSARGVRASVQRAMPTLTADDGRGRHDLQTLLRLLDQAEERTQRLAQLSDETFGQARQDTTQLGLLSEALTDVVLSVRLLPVASIVGPFERMVRDLARASGKQVQLEVVGGETEMDRKILEQLRDPLVHLLRNAVDHGLELPAEREAAGKPALGTIRLTAAQRGSAIEVTLEDDGTGLDPARLRAVVEQKGLLSAEKAAGLDDRAAVELIFLPGFSTRTTVTQTSGRGVGMDVVRENVERLNGHVSVESRPGQGTRFVLAVPLTLATTRAVLVEQMGQSYALPASSIEGTFRGRPDAEPRAEGRPIVEYQGRPLPLADLGALLELEMLDGSVANPAWRSYVVLRQGERRVVLHVDRLIGEREIVVKSLGWPLSRVRNVSGAAVLGSGQVVMILNPADVLKAGLRLPTDRGTPSLRRAAPARAERRRRVLVADDSLTTRTLERSILEAAGYDVQIAADGGEALHVLRGQPIDLVVSDVDMPVLDGFALTSEIRRDEKLKQIPVVLVTSLDAQQHRERGVAVGADAYVVKSQFDQEELLAAIRRLI